MVDATLPWTFPSGLVNFRYPLSFWTFQDLGYFTVNSFAGSV